MKLEFDIPDGFPVEEIQRSLFMRLQALLKKHRPKRPSPGRPALDATRKRLNARARAMLKYFDKLRETVDRQDYEHFFAEAEHSLLVALKYGDEKMITLLEETQPWTRRSRS